MFGVEYESRIIEIMMQDNYSKTLREAILQDMKEKEIDCNSVFSMTDYLEYNMKYNMDKVNYYMNVVTGNYEDKRLVKANEEEK